MFAGTSESSNKGREPFSFIVENLRLETVSSLLMSPADPKGMSFLWETKSRTLNESFHSQPLTHKSCYTF